MVFVCFSVGLRLIRPPAVPAPWCCYTIYITTPKKFPFSDFSRLSVAPVSVVIASRIEVPPTLCPDPLRVSSLYRLLIGSPAGRPACRRLCFVRPWVCVYAAVVRCVPRPGCLCAVPAVVYPCRRSPPLCASACVCRRSPVGVVAVLPDPLTLSPAVLFLSAHTPPPGCLRS